MRMWQDFMWFQKKIWGRNLKLVWNACTSCVSSILSVQASTFSTPTTSAHLVASSKPEHVATCGPFRKRWWLRWRPRCSAPYSVHSCRYCRCDRYQSCQKFTEMYLVCICICIYTYYCGVSWINDGPCLQLHISGCYMLLLCITPYCWDLPLNFMARILFYPFWKSTAKVKITFPCHPSSMCSCRISSKSIKAWSHCLPFSQALMAALKAMALQKPDPDGSEYMPPYVPRCHHPSLSP